MTLNEYLRTKPLAIEDFAVQVGASVAAVKKWLRRDRLPRPAMLAKIEAETGGAVRPNDFFETPTPAASPQDAAVA